MYNKPLGEQLSAFLAIIGENPVVTSILHDPPFDDGTPWYITSGVLYQSVWNSLLGKPLLENVKDCDIIYFDTDRSKEKESATEARIQEKYKHLPLIIEPINQARVHLWHHEDFYGYTIAPYTSCEESITRWPSTTVCIGVTQRDGVVQVFAPYGLNDIFGMIGRPNIASGLRLMYEGKSRKWQRQWPDITILPWPDEKRSVSV